MSAIFISYRREDAAGWAGRLEADLAREFPGHEVFQDIGSIGIGEDFVDAMRRYLATCAITIVVIGPRWLDVKDNAGARRLDDPEDWVRLEIEESLRRDGLRVVPVLVGGAVMPRGAELPESIRLLARRNAHEITDRRWTYDASQLVEALRRIPALESASANSGNVERLAASLVTRPDTAPSAATPPPGSIFRDGDDCPEMVVIPAGSFLMGSPAGEKDRRSDEGPQHRITIARPFAAGKYEVTFEEWGACVVAGGCAWNPGDAGWGGGRRPVINVSWEDAQAYVKWLSNKTGKAYRLLSEAEWEYAARAGTTARYPWGDESGKDQGNFDGSGSKWSNKQTAPVGSFPPNAFGLHDMIGNVWEWTQDCWNESYEGGPTNGGVWESGNCGLRVVRGGSWLNTPLFARVAVRFRIEPASRDSILGFRLARTL